LNFNTISKNENLINKMFRFNKIQNITKYITRRYYSEYHGMKNCDIVSMILKKHGVENVFLYNGGSVMGITDSIHRHKINYFINANEFCAGSSAIGYAKSSQKTGVLIVTSGPGLTGSISPIADANNDSTPLVVLSGQVPVSSMGKDSFQECDSVSITKSITKWNYCVKDPSEFPYVLETAFRIANDQKKGAVHIDIPKCVSHSVFNYDKVKSIKLEDKFYWIDKPVKYIDRNLKDVTTQCMYNMLVDSEKPVLYIGQGCSEASEELRQFAIRNQIPVTTTLHGVGIFDETHELSLEMCGMHGSMYANYALQQSDCIFAIGSRFDDRTTGLVEKYAPMAKNILHIDISPHQIGKVIKDKRYKYLVKDAKEALKELNRIKHIPRQRDGWLKQIRDWKIQYPFTYEPSENLKTQQVLEELNKQLSNDYIITTDVGSHQMWTSQYIKWNKPRTMLSSGSLGCMGVGLPYAIGAKIAFPNKTLIAVCGDFSFDMSLNDLKTVKEYNIPVKIMVMNDGAQSMVWAWTQYFFEGREAGVLRKNKDFPKYAEIAKGYGIESMVCDSSETLKESIRKMMEFDGPILVEFKVEKDKCFPLVKPGCSLDETMYKDEKYVADKNTMAPC